MLWCLPSLHRRLRLPESVHICKLEAGGILIIGALILLLTLARYWHHIAWSAR